MKKPILGMALVLASACVVCAQENMSASSARGTENAAAFENTSAAQVNLFNASGSEPFALSAPAPAAPEPAATPADPAATPKFVWGERDDYRWQLCLGGEFFRFRSKVFNASAGGINTTITYFTNTWFAVEGDFIAAFAPPLTDNNHVKYFQGAGGIRIGGRRARFEPFGHALVGGAHMQPQTAAGSRTALAVTGGGGLDFRINSRLSVRGEADYVYTQFYHESQDNFAASLGLVFHF